MKRVEWENLVIGNIYYDIRPRIALQRVKMKLTSINEQYAHFLPIGDYNCYNTDDEGRIKFNKTHFYTPEFKFGRKI